MDSANSLITPIYRANALSNSIFLREGPLKITGQNATIQGSGHASLQLNRRFKLIVEASLESSNGFEFFGESSVDLLFGEGFCAVRALITSLKTESAAQSARAELLPNPQRMVFKEASAGLLNSVTFHIVNFPQFASLGKGGRSIVHETKRLGEILLQHNGWKITIQEMPETEELIDKLKGSGGFGITHVGFLERKDGESFSAADSEAVLQNLYLFLSFVRGAWSSPLLPVGFNQAGQRVYEDWGIRITTPWEPRSSWFDTHHGEWLAPLYSPFVSLLHCGELGRSVTNALYWYLRSNRGGEGAGIDSGIILGQAALERITTSYLDEQGYVAPGKDNAAERLRETFSRLQISAEISDGTPSLLQHKGSAWKDGPEAITKIRNELVHPKGRLPFKVGAVIPDAWRLSQRYVELLILRLAGYEGDHSNRLTARWIGQVEPVPWA